MKQLLGSAKGDANTVLTPPKLDRRYETTSFMSNLEAEETRMRWTNPNSIDYSHQYFEDRRVPFSRLRLTIGSHDSGTEKEFTCIP